VRITSVDCFRVQVPWPEEELRAGKIGDLAFTRVRTDAGVTGWGFQAVPRHLLDEVVRPLLVGNDPYRIEEHLQRGLVRAASAEWALWDIIGKAAGQPVHRLLGHCRDRIPVYLTIVWRNQRDLTPAQQVDDLVRYVGLGFRAVKVQIWRDDPYQDVEIVRGVRERIGGRDKLEIMFDRTAGLPGSVWDFDTALEVARQLEELDAGWLEEPLQHRDLVGHARLAEAVDIPITGGERDNGVRPWARYCAHRAFDILQPDGYLCGGITTMRKIGALAEGFDIPLIIHGTHGLALAPYFQVAATIPSCRIHEIVHVTPPLTPLEQWEPIGKLLNTPELYHLEGDVLTIPTGPGLGVDLNEEAVMEYSVPLETPPRPGPYTRR
jgi:D-galactarolactone cycloisomerase